MLRSKFCTIVLFRVCSSRWVSGYKIKPENYLRKQALENCTEEDKLQEKIDLAVMKRARSKLRGLEKITDGDLMERLEGPDPNEPYRGQDDLPTYGSLQSYYLAAESERRRQRKEGVWWETLDKHRILQPEFEDIGLRISEKNEIESNTSQKEKHLRETRDDKDLTLEKSATNRTLIISLEKVMDEWEDEKVGIEQIKEIAHHYNVYQDLFQDSDFYPILPMQIEYRVDDELVNPVYYGNELLPSEVETQPFVHFETEPGIFYTLLCTNPDGHLEDNNREYAQWLVGNIPGKEFALGETLLDYMRPFPARGTGYQRVVFVLFQQSQTIDFSFERRQQPCTTLHDRDFKTSEFFQKYEEYLVPVSLRFFQSKWEYSVQNTYQKILNMPEPVYEYEKLSKKARLTKLKFNPRGKTLQWLARFMPKEPVYPDGNQETIRLIRDAAIKASVTPQTGEKQNFSVKNVY